MPTTSRVVSLGLAIATSAGTGRVVGGFATSVAGGLLVASPKSNSCLGSKDTFCGYGEVGVATGTRVVGGVMIAAGLVLAITRYVELGPDAPATPAATEPKPAAVTVSRSIAASLDIGSAMERQLAIQASVAARRGDCTAASTSGRRLRAVAPEEVHRRLVAADQAHAGCLQ